ncbi:MAG: F0F1 ATP synthase subunit delta [Prevotella sp.]|jgi:F-type H+-transporting ATPase subunit delta|nr:F0F1 ATP synthase subunit delta [Prevotella sp.]MBQ9179038.1 F0F1 ATP synthase subunit delta [Prevotella sp.]MBQ9670347.1 F0F1 ATP synthase subunit delta [Prevotella sp.]MBR1527279.1 F0F1 ATP synthase subunit delta [Prevotella sp.]
MDIGVISVRYARALLKSALEQKLDEAVYQDMQTLSNSYIDVPQLRLTICNPMMAKDKKRDLLLTACGANHSQLSEAFVNLVLGEDREDILQFISNAYITLYRQHKNVIRAKLITANTASEDMVQKMKQMVESRTKGSVEFETETNPEIIGGFILEYDTYRMDASVKNKLNTILHTLKK